MKQFKLDRSVQRQLNSVQRALNKEFKALKIPKNGGGWIYLAGLAVVGVAAYLIITNKDLLSPKAPVFDPLVDELGDVIPGVEGIAEDTFLEDLPIGSSAPSKDSAYVSARQAESLAATVGDRLSIA